MIRGSEMRSNKLRNKCLCRSLEMWTIGTIIARSGRCESRCPIKPICASGTPYNYWWRQPENMDDLGHDLAVQIVHQIVQMRAKIVPIVQKCMI